VNPNPDSIIEYALNWLAIVAKQLRVMVNRPISCRILLNSLRFCLCTELRKLCLRKRNLVNLATSFVAPPSERIETKQLVSAMSAN